MKTKQMDKKQAWIIEDAPIKGVNFEGHLAFNVDEYFDIEYKGTILKYSEEMEYLKSYESYVLGYNATRHKIYLFPRFDYSSTTSRHVTCYLSRRLGVSVTMKELKQAIKDNVCFHGKEIIVCNGYYNEWDELKAW